MDFLEAQAAVLQLYGQYADAIHRRDPEDWGDTWCSDARWTLPLVDTPDQPLILEGREAIVQTWSAVIENFPIIQHMPFAPLVRVDGGEVKARWTVSENLVKADGTADQVLGIYDDLHKVEDGKLRYSDRKFYVLSRRPTPADFDAFPHPGKL